MLLLLAAGSAFCCDCKAPPLCRRVFSAGAIFIGKVTDDGADTPGARPSRDTQFAIEENIKGLPKGTKTAVVNPSRETGCWIPFERGHRYLVIAFGTPADLGTGMCSGSGEIEKAGKELVEIRKLAQVPPPVPAPPRSIRARVTWWDGAPVQEAYVECRTDPDDPCVAPTVAAVRTDAAGVAECKVPSDSSAAVFVGTMLGDRYNPPRFLFGHEIFEEIFLDDPFDAQVPFGPNATRLEVVLTQKNESARKAADKARSSR